MLNNSRGTVSEYLTGFLSWNFSGTGRFIPDTVDVWWNEPDPRKFPSHGNTCGEFGRPSNRTNVAGQFVTRLAARANSERETADPCVRVQINYFVLAVKNHSPGLVDININDWWVIPRSFLSISKTVPPKVSKLFWKEPNIR